MMNISEKVRLLFTQFVDGTITKFPFPLAATKEELDEAWTIRRSSHKFTAVDVSKADLSWMATIIHKKAREIETKKAAEGESKCSLQTCEWKLANEKEFYCPRHSEEFKLLKSMLNGGFCTYSETCMTMPSSGNTVCAKHKLEKARDEKDVGTEEIKTLPKSLEDRIRLMMYPRLQKIDELMTMEWRSLIDFGMTTGDPLIQVQSGEGSDRPPGYSVHDIFRTSSGTIAAFIEQSCIDYFKFWQGNDRVMNWQDGGTGVVHREDNKSYTIYAVYYPEKPEGYVPRTGGKKKFLIDLQVAATLAGFQQMTYKPKWNKPAGKAICKKIFSPAAAD